MDSSPLQNISPFPLPEFLKAPQNLLTPQDPFPLHFFSQKCRSTKNTASLILFPALQTLFLLLSCLVKP